MKVSYSWLKELVDFDWSPEELAHQLTMIGLEVDAVTPYGQGLDRILTGKVIAKHPHPRADKLSLCQVDIGGRQVRIVCGAPNVQAGQVVPVVLPGTTLPNGTVIQVATLRGETSEGMICSKKELGLADSADGIMVLPAGTAVGRKLPRAIPVTDTVLELEIGPNRPDCFSHIGIAREIRGLTGRRLKLPRQKKTGMRPPSGFTIKIEKAGDCFRYAGRLLRDLKIGQSPSWLQQRLEALGLRAINNVVDITNYVLLEYGHPLHAFDAERLAGNRIIVRRARAGESLVTIDGTECRLDSSVLVIADAEKPVALAGIMGGADSQVTERTGRILLESAYFHPTLVRKGARKLGLATEASLRFERGMDPNQAVPALNRAVDLITKVAGGVCQGGTIDVCPRPVQEARIRLRSARITRILGVDVPPGRTRTILKNLGCGVTAGGRGSLKVAVPTFRVDLTREIDLIEEVARIYQYDRIEADTRAQGSIETARHPEDTAAGAMRDRLVACGMQEVVTNSLVRAADIQRVTPQTAPVMLQNATSRDMDALRTSLLISLLPVIQWNLNRQCPDLRLFEINKVFRASGPAGPLEEKLTVAGIQTGQRYPTHWSRQPEPAEVHDLQGIVDSFLTACQVGEVSYRQGTTDFLQEAGVAVATGAETIGCLGTVQPGMLSGWGIDTAVHYFELDFQAVARALARSRVFEPLPKYPSLRRDLSLLVDRGVPVGDLLGVIRQTGSPLVCRVELFDLYQGDNIPAGQKSLAFSLEYRSDEKTLTDREADAIHQNIISVLHSTFNAQLRSL